MPAEIRILLYSIIAFFVAVIYVIVFGKIDDVVKVKGIIRTKENVSTVKNVISGKIIEKSFMPGQKVNKGDFLYSVDPSIYKAQKDSLTSEKNNLKERLNGLEQVLESYKSNKNLVNKNNLVAHSRYQSFLNNVEKLEIQKNIAYEALKDEKNLPENLRNPQVIKQKQMQYDYNIKNLESYKADFYNSIIEERDKLELSFFNDIQELQKLESSFEFLKVYAPVSGFIQELSNLNLGDYIVSGESVLNIIPNDSENFRVEMMVLPKDMGKITTGLKVKYRLSAFPYFEYKGAEGKIVAVDPDIRSSGNQLYYTVYADINRVVFENRHGDSFPIRAGLDTTCRIVMKNDSILFFLLKKLDFLN